ncbi:hypothetical protein HDU96_001590 [Phlyctochytrium bullatum]|nr:hypothetical protein HDU96_001590 [Phlyctochytrium bullatum]
MEGEGGIITDGMAAQMPKVDVTNTVIFKYILENEIRDAKQMFDHLKADQNYHFIYEHCVNKMGGDFGKVNTMISNAYNVTSTAEIKVPSTYELVVSFYDNYTKVNGPFLDAYEVMDVVLPLRQFLFHHGISDCTFYAWCIRNLFLADEDRSKTSGIIYGASNTGKSSLLRLFEGCFEGFAVPVPNTGGVYVLAPLVNKVFMSVHELSATVRSRAITAQQWLDLLEAPEMLLARNPHGAAVLHKHFRLLACDQSPVRLKDALEKVNFDCDSFSNRLNPLYLRGPPFPKRSKHNFAPIQLAAFILHYDIYEKAFLHQAQRIVDDDVKGFVFDTHVFKDEPVFVT